ncbi:MAG: GDP-fucose synthetase [Sphingomonadales bacterium BRH_c3]|nr:MAG: GDP-fucose synthetase [Sphingomonadales bacterium BRH_c3]
MYPLEGKRIWLAGHGGMVGRALARQLQKEDATVLVRTRQELDLADYKATFEWIGDNKPDTVIVAAAQVSGIIGNQLYPADHLYNNLVVAMNIIHAAHQHKVEKLLYLGSSCIYPKFAEIPINEDSLLSGPLEPTNEGYAIAKITGLKLAELYRQQYGHDFISVMPTNMYGPGDNFDPETSHVIPGLIQRIHHAKINGADSITIWGTGTPMREMLHVDDGAEAMLHVLKNYSGKGHINIGSGVDWTILELAEAVCRTVGFEGKVECDKSKPDGTARKLMNSDKLRALRWAPKIGLEEGLRDAYDWYLREVWAGGTA